MPRIPAIEELLTITPARRSTIEGMTCLQRVKRTSLLRVNPHGQKDRLADRNDFEVPIGDLLCQKGRVLEAVRIEIAGIECGIRNCIVAFRSAGSVLNRTRIANAERATAMHLWPAPSPARPRSVH